MPPSRSQPVQRGWRWQWTLIGKNNKNKILFLLITFYSCCSPSENQIPHRHGQSNYVQAKNLASRSPALWFILSAVANVIHTDTDRTRVSTSNETHSMNAAIEEVHSIICFPLHNFNSFSLFLSFNYPLAILNLFQSCNIYWILSWLTSIAVHTEQFSCTVQYGTHTDTIALTQIKVPSALIVHKNLI